MALRASTGASEVADRCDHPPPAREREFGARVALGSSRGAIAALMFRQAGLWAAVGLALGAAGVVVDPPDGARRGRARRARSPGNGRRYALGAAV